MRRSTSDIDFGRLVDLEAMLAGNAELVEAFPAMARRHAEEGLLGGGIAGGCSSSALMIEAVTSSETLSHILTPIPVMQSRCARNFVADPVMHLSHAEHLYFLAPPWEGRMSGNSVKCFFTAVATFTFMTCRMR